MHCGITSTVAVEKKTIVYSFGQEIPPFYRTQLLMCMFGKSPPLNFIVSQPIGAQIL
jgi:hypothetical protein